MSHQPFHLLGLCGSLRAQSFNHGLLRATAEMLPEGVTFEEFDIGTLPHFNEDVRLQGEPEPVRDLKARMAAADALLIASPEYNYSVPGVLKNALDWASRPPNASPLRQKPVAIMGAAINLTGTARMQLALRQVFVFTESYVLLKPEVYVRDSPKKFDAEGHLHDPETRDQVAALVRALIEWAHRVGRAVPA